MYTTGAYTINIAWNEAPSAKSLATTYNNRVRATLGFDLFDSSTWWKRSEFLMGSLESLAADGGVAFSELISELAEDIRKLSVSEGV